MGQPEKNDNRQILLTTRDAILLRTVFSAFFDGSHSDEYLEGIKNSSETVRSFCRKMVEAFPEMKRDNPEYGTIAYYGHPTASLGDDEIVAEAK